MSGRSGRRPYDDESGPVVFSFWGSQPGFLGYMTVPVDWPVASRRTPGRLKLGHGGTELGQAGISVTGPAGVYETVIVEATSAHASVALDPLMAGLESAAAAGNEPAFMDVLKEMDWPNRPAKDYILGTKLALEVGAHLAARRLATEGAQAYPGNLELQKYAHVLAPPKVRRSPAPANPGLRANREWLQTHGAEYAGRWVALRGGRLLGDARSLDELKEKIGDSKGVLLTAVY